MSTIDKLNKVIAQLDDLADDPEIPEKIRGETHVCANNLRQMGTEVIGTELLQEP